MIAQISQKRNDALPYYEIFKLKLAIKDKLT